MGTKTSAFFHLILSLALLFTPSFSFAQVKLKKTRTYTVNCSATNFQQLCDVSQLVALNIKGKSAKVSVKYTPSELACSSVRVHLSRDGQEVALSTFTEFGVSSPSPVKMKLGKLAPGKYLLGFQAEGTLGGCNSGYLGSWGGKFKFTATEAGSGGSKPIAGLIVPLGTPKLSFNF